MSEGLGVGGMEGLLAIGCYRSLVIDASVLHPEEAQELIYSRLFLLALAIVGDQLYKFRPET